MRAQRATIWLVAAAIAVGSTSTALASQSISYKIHETPEDPNSAVVFVVTLTVDEAVRDGDKVGWEVLEAHIEQPGTPADVWVKSAPLVWTTDGLWWITHADPDHPLLDEFASPPAITGTAQAQGQGTENLNFELEGRAYDQQIKGSPYAVNGALDYVFALVNTTEPLKEGGEETVDLDGGSNIGGG
jgi:hypothetical protein